MAWTASAIELHAIALTGLTVIETSDGTEDLLGSEFDALESIVKVEYYVATGNTYASEANLNVALGFLLAALALERISGVNISSIRMADITLYYRKLESNPYWIHGMQMLQDLNPEDFIDHTDYDEWTFRNKSKEGVGRLTSR